MDSWEMRRAAASVVEGQDLGACTSEDAYCLGGEADPERPWCGTLVAAFRRFCFVSVDRERPCKGSTPLNAPGPGAYSPMVLRSSRSRGWSPLRLSSSSHVTYHGPARLWVGSSCVCLGVGNGLGCVLCCVSTSGCYEAPRGRRRDHTSQTSVSSSVRDEIHLSRVIDYDLNETTYKTQTNIIAKRETHKSTFHL